MDFALSDEQTQLYDSIASFARDVVEPGAGERDREGRFDRDVWDACGEVGLTGICISEEHGGGGAGAVDTGIALEALAYGGKDAGLGLSMGAHLVIGAKPIDLLGTPEQKATYLPKLASGEWIGAWGITEPDHGSDTSGITSRAVRDGNEWVLNGTKTFITNGPVCDVFTVICRTREEDGAKGMTGFILPIDTPGLTVGKVLDKSGNRSSPTSEMVMEDVRVGDDAVLGTPGTAQWSIGFECFSWERTVMLGSAIGGMERGLDDTIAYAKQREAFGKPIAHFQAIQHKFADMKINLESSRLMLRYGAWLKDQGRDHMIEASMAKAYIAKCALENADNAIQVHGGWGYIKDYPVERAWRDAKLSSIGGGTTEIQKMIISRMLLA